MKHMLHIHIINHVPIEDHRREAYGLHALYRYLKHMLQIHIKDHFLIEDHRKEAYGFHVKH